MGLATGLTVFVLGGLVLYSWDLHLQANAKARSEPGTARLAHEQTTPTQQLAEAAEQPRGAPSAPQDPAHTRNSGSTIEEIKIAIDAVPTTADVLVDGVWVGATPYEGAFPQGPAKRQLTLIAKGYAPTRKEVTFDRNLRLSFHLQKVSPTKGVRRTDPSGL